MPNKKIKYILIFEGNGKGTRVFQNYLDGHSQITMIPGTISSYFYIFYKKFNKYNSKQILNLFNIYFKSLFKFNFSKDHIRKQKKFFLLSKKKIFNKEFLKLHRKSDKNFFNFINSIHYAYAKALGVNLSKIKYFLIHIHNYIYMREEILVDFPVDTKIIFFSESRIEQNCFRREFNSLIKSNHLNLPLSRNYFQSFFSYIQIFDYLTKPVKDLENIKYKIFFVRFKEFNSNRLKFIKRTLRLLDLKNEKICFTQTILKKPLIKDYSKNYQTNDYFIETIKNFKEDKRSIYLIKALLKKFFIKTKQYKKNEISNYNFFILLKILIPNKRELFSLYLTFLNLKIFKYFFMNLIIECFNIKKKVLKKYEKNLLINEKFTYNIYINFFAFDNFLIRKNKKIISKNKIILILFSLIYFLNNSLLFFLSPIIIFINYLIRVKKNIYFYFYNKHKTYKFNNITII